MAKKSKFIENGERIYLVEDRKFVLFIHYLRFIGNILYKLKKNTGKFPLPLIVQSDSRYIYVCTFYLCNNNLMLI